MVTVSYLVLIEPKNGFETEKVKDGYRQCGYLPLPPTSPRETYIGLKCKCRDIFVCCDALHIETMRRSQMYLLHVCMCVTHTCETYVWYHTYLRDMCRKIHVRHIGYHMYP